MRYAIVLAPQAIRDLRLLSARMRAGIRDALETHLRNEPEKRIKRLRGISRPQYRLRVGEVRVFYDVRDETVEVLAILSKDQVEAWLEDHGRPDAVRGAGQDEG